jgi:hypothetical protein
MDTIYIYTHTLLLIFLPLPVLNPTPHPSSTSAYSIQTCTNVICTEVYTCTPDRSIRMFSVQKCIYDKCTYDAFLHTCVCFCTSVYTNALAPMCSRTQGYICALHKYRSTMWVQKYAYKCFCIRIHFLLHPFAPLILAARARERERAQPEHRGHCRWTTPRTPPPSTQILASVPPGQLTHIQDIQLYVHIQLYVRESSSGVPRGDSHTHRCGAVSSSCVCGHVVCPPAACLCLCVCVVCPSLFVRVSVSMSVYPCLYVCMRVRTCCMPPVNVPRNGHTFAVPRCHATRGRGVCVPARCVSPADYARCVSPAVCLCVCVSVSVCILMYASAAMYAPSCVCVDHPAPAVCAWIIEGHDLTHAHSAGGVRAHTSATRPPAAGMRVRPVF